MMVNDHPYEQLSDVYDTLVGARDTMDGYLITLMKKYVSPGGSILEIACGTGTVLAKLQQEYKVSGLDSSPAMLAKAREKLPFADLFVDDMTSFSLSDSYDLVMCVFDSINHLETLAQWQKVFHSAKQALNDSGVFIFDMNTIRKLDALSVQPTNTFAVTKESAHTYRWDIHTGNSVIALYEYSFPVEEVVRYAGLVFKNVEVVREDTRAYFVCW